MSNYKERSTLVLLEPKIAARWRLLQMSKLEVCEFFFCEKNLVKMTVVKSKQSFTNFSMIFLGSENNSNFSVKMKINLNRVSRRFDKKFRK